MYQLKYNLKDKDGKPIIINGIYMGVAFANSIGVTKDKYLMKRHEAKGATVTTLPANSSMGQMTQEK